MPPYNPPAVKQPGTRQHNAPDNSRGDVPGCWGFSPRIPTGEGTTPTDIHPYAGLKPCSSGACGGACVRWGGRRVVVCVVVVRASGGACGGGACGGACMRWVGRPVVRAVGLGRAEVVRAVVRASVRWGGAGAGACMRWVGRVLVRAMGWGVLWCVRWGGRAEVVRAVVRACGGWGGCWCVRWGGACCGACGGGTCGRTCGGTCGGAWGGAGGLYVRWGWGGCG
ncbi:hypothetical protein EV137_7865 [Kribbella pratensis]|uniref:Uncharacterized protein n=1 Tax=Kribbella pratensis TaxID=2512112 RepID=A0ABY2F663_9ACTN|nr:hypothetical protein EV137_7865 [Kribbella pratensis]